MVNNTKDSLVKQEKIVNYLTECIDDKYKNRREFCRQYLKLSNGEYTNEEVAKMANRLSQILNCKKMIQGYDLIYFSRLLDISCEEILSGGEQFGPIVKRTTNYTVASSDDPKQWEEYIALREKLGKAHDEDEYGKTLMDYALEFGNKKLVSYLVDREKISIEYTLDGYNGRVPIATTSVEKDIIKKRKSNDIDTALLNEMSFISSERYRQKIIDLAVKNDDIEMLQKLRAKEMLELYYLNYISGGNFDISKSYDNKTIKYISKASKKVLDYFTSEFVIIDDLKHENHYMYPYISELIDELVVSENKFTSEILERAIQHNQYVYGYLGDLVKLANKDDKEYWIKNNREYSDFLEKRRIASLINLLKLCFKFNEKNGLVHLFVDYEVKRKRDGIVSNIVCSTKKSKDKELQSKLDKLNELYDKIKNFKESLEEIVG